MSTLVTFGEAMVRLAPPGHRRLHSGLLVELEDAGAVPRVVPSPGSGSMGHD